MMKTLTNTAVQTDAWVELLTEPEAQQLRLWHYRWRPNPVTVRGPEQLTVLLASLRAESDFAGITDEDNDRWAQVKRVGAGWWVEGRCPSEEWPSAFVPEGLVEGQRERTTADHACWSHHAAAEIVWAWLDGRSVAGAVRIPAP